MEAPMFFIPFHSQATVCAKVLQVMSAQVWPIQWYNHQSLEASLGIGDGGNIGKGQGRAGGSGVGNKCHIWQKHGALNKCFFSYNIIYVPNLYQVS